MGVGRAQGVPAGSHTEGLEAEEHNQLEVEGNQLEVVDTAAGHQHTPEHFHTLERLLVVAAGSHTWEEEQLVAAVEEDLCQTLSSS